MQNRLDRQVVFFDLKLDSNPPGALPPMDELAAYLKERVDDGLCVRRIEADRYMIGITKARVVKKSNGANALALLFVFVDPDAADPANMHLQTMEARFFDKLEGEGRAVSAHAIMDLEPRFVGDRVFRVLLENADRLGKTRVRQMMAREFSQIFKDKELTVQNVNGDDVKARPTIDMDAVASERLKKGMKDGRLKEVTLIDSTLHEEGFDAPDAVKIKRREMALKVDVPIGKTIQQALEAVRPWAHDNGFDQMYVTWERPKPEDGVDKGLRATPERAKINLAQADIGETLFAQKEFVRLEQPLADLCLDLSDELVGLMAKILD